jgi:hypothetical protein
MDASTYVRSAHASCGGVPLGQMSMISDYSIEELQIINPQRVVQEGEICDWRVKEE